MGSSGVMIKTGGGDNKDKFNIRGIFTRDIISGQKQTNGDGEDPELEAEDVVLFLL